MKLNKILVFGGSGFMGSHLADELIKNNKKVLIYDTKKNPFLKKNQKFLRGNILDKKKVIKSSKNFKIIYHFAGITDLEEANLNPMSTIYTNIIGTINILEACKINKIKKIIFASSIYALSEQGGFYSVTKNSSEMLIEKFCEHYKIKYTILRFGSLYGTRSGKKNSIKNLITQGMKNGKIIRNTNGKEVRNYINVKDCAKVCVRILNSKYNNKYFNIIGKKSWKIRNIIKIISNKIPIKKIEFFPEKATGYHYINDPFTFKIKKGEFIKNKKEINISKGIDEIINELQKKN
jgi:UDP-glucose 4-epimerase